MLSIDKNSRIVDWQPCRYCRSTTRLSNSNCLLWIDHIGTLDDWQIHFGYQLITGKRCRLRTSFGIGMLLIANPSFLSLENHILVFTPVWSIGISFLCFCGFNWHTGFSAVHFVNVHVIFSIVVVSRVRPTYMFIQISPNPDLTPFWKN